MQVGTVPHYIGPMLSSRRATHLLLAAGLAASSVTCGDENLTRPTPDTPGGELVVAGPPAKMSLNRQPPANALHGEVWNPSNQPRVAGDKPGAAATVPVRAGLAGVVSGVGMPPV